MSKSLVQSQFGANAEHYLSSSVHAKGASLARLVELVQPKPDWRMLDIATGAGHTAAAFAPHVAEAVASDLTPQMLQQAEKLAQSRGLANMVTKPADAEALPFPDASFDLVTCRIAAHHFPDARKFVSEVKRVLKPGGTFAFVDNVSPDTDTTPGFSAAELADAARTYNTLEKIRDPSHGRALTTSEWRHLCEGVGLKVTHIEHSPKAMSFDLWCKNQSVPADLVPGLADTLRNAKPAFAAFLKPTDGDEGLGFTLTELILIARKPA